MWMSPEDYRAASEGGQAGCAAAALPAALIVGSAFVPASVWAAAPLILVGTSGGDAETAALIMTGGLLGAGVAAAERTLAFDGIMLRGVKEGVSAYGREASQVVPWRVPLAPPPSAGRGLPVVAGREVPPRLATAKEYRWANPRMKKGNFIEADLEHGVLSATVRSHGPDELRRGGAKLMDDAFGHFGPQNIQSFKAQWVRNSNYTTNYAEYSTNLAKGMDPTKAAWETWTGRQMQSRGFSKVLVEGDAAEYTAWFSR